MDLREAIELLKKDNNQLIETDILVDPNAELSGVYRHVGAGGTVMRPTKIDGPAMIFNKVTQLGAIWQDRHQNQGKTFWELSMQNSRHFAMDMWWYVLVLEEETAEWQQMNFLLGERLAMIQKRKEDLWEELRHLLLI